VIDLTPLQKTNIILCILSTHTNSICLQEKKREEIMSVVVEETDGGSHGTSS
jgi:hypothetical protein